jgi:CRISPR/Cas system-associated exonuclease Cas4 (RecB family)
MSEELERDVIEDYKHAISTGLERYEGKNSLIEVIHEQMKLNNNSESGLHDPCKFYPSSAGKCSRAIVYQMMGYEQEELDGRTLLIFENGNGYHTRMENLFHDTGLLIAPELSFEKPEWRISGRSDAVIKNFLPHKSSGNIIKLYEPEFQRNEDGSTYRDKNNKKVKVGEKLLYEGADNDLIIVELKSISDKGFGYLDKYGAKEYHIKQLQLYLYLTGVRQGMLLYENKNTQELKEFFIPYDEAVAKTVIDQIVLVNGCIDTHTLPPKEYEQTDYECRYCSYNSICWPVKNTYSLEDIL